MSSISNESPISLYLQIKNIITQQIKEGVLSAGNKIPSERELCEQYNVSRITVRQSLNELEKEGLVNKIHGKGTFVAQPKVEQPLVTVTSFQNTLLSKGLKPKTKFIKYVVLPNSYKISNILSIPLSEKIVELTLIGLDDETPMVVYNSYFAYDLGVRMQELAEQASAENRPFSTFDLYERIPELTLGTISQTFEASIADASIAKLLSVKKNTPILIVESIIYTNENLPVEYKTAIYRGDKYKFSMVRKI